MIMMVFISEPQVIPNTVLGVLQARAVLTLTVLMSTQASLNCVLHSVTMKLCKVRAACINSFNPNNNPEEVDY